MKLSHIFEGRIDEPIIAYHGTSNLYRDSILTHGLHPDFSGSGWGSDLIGNSGGRDLTSFGGVYFTTNERTASDAASHIVNKNGGNLMFVVAQIHEKSAMLDEDIIDELLEDNLYNILRDLNYQPKRLPEFALEMVFMLENDYKIGVELTSNLLNKIISDYPELQPLLDNYSLIVDEIYEFIYSHFLRSASYIFDRPRLYIDQFYDKYFRDDFDNDSDFKTWLQDEFLPRKAEAEQDYKNVMDILTRRFNRIIDSDDSSRTNLFRINEPVTFSGNNRILAIVEVVGSRYIGDGYYKVQVNIPYGNESYAIPFIEKAFENINYEII